MLRYSTEQQHIYKRGWYRKGRLYRFLYATNYSGMVIYQSKTNMIRNSNAVSSVDSTWNDWFDRAEYLGLENPFE
ncbi:hypothetical protein IR166_28715 [Enterococcus faecalis]|nr:hypothetical protein [Enterococcus faecalis]GMG60105.1 hypothetical protein AH4_34470 [Enterococcus gallinarum]